MKLKEYLREHRLTQEQFLDLIKKRSGHKLSQGALSKYVVGQRIPRRDEMMALWQTTDGQVSPNDFYLKEAAAEEELTVQ